MLSSRVFRVSPVHHASFRKLFVGNVANSRIKKGFQQDQLLKNCNPRMQHRSFIFSRNNVAGGKGLLSQTTPVKKESAITLTRIAYAVKLVRLPFLLVAISTIGYQQGVTDTLRNPRKLQQRTFESILIDFGVEPSSDQVEIVTERGVRSRFDTPLGSLGRGKVATIDPRSEKIAIVGREILKSAQTYVRENFEDAVEKAKDEIMKDDVNIKEQKLAKLLNEDFDVQVCVAALERIEGAALEGIQNWSYVLISSPIPNAFVSEMLPQKIFVTTGLFDEIVNNDDELAMILGHEVSHLIKGHNSEASAFESFIRGAEILVLLLDPTEGLLSLGVASFLSTSREALVAALSRENELEADELGCRLAAMSCYDTGRGVEVFRKMQETDSDDSAASKLNLMSSHPTSQDRYENVQNLVETQNYSEYSYCNTLQKRITRAFKQKEY